ncbi:hypothetical protein K402DRAFT_551 [Aulographum hederae CBS 113979]|uniref:Uncharacterized protein n=1 Tax=Aulographum hederae CBS 113979 TaxID=1176131 RepID=A0A6G1HGA0_9PEZI|nr:hypothetical protein K402DRAFT_551 [Aulographum hederae CBS 113979]
MWTLDSGPVALRCCSLRSPAASLLIDIGLPCVMLSFSCAPQRPPFRDIRPTCVAALRDKPQIHFRSGSEGRNHRNPESTLVPGDGCVQVQKVDGSSCPTSLRGVRNQLRLVAAQRRTDLEKARQLRQILSPGSLLAKVDGRYVVKPAPSAPISSQ